MINVEKYKNEILDEIKSFETLGLKSCEGKAIVNVYCKYNNVDSCYLTEALEWLFSEEKIKLTKLEYDLLEYFNGDLSKIGSSSIFNALKKKGYYETIDPDMTLTEILENCEVINDN